jgi:hypothetical protein
MTDRATFREILRSWIRSQPSGTVIKSRALFAWAAQAVTLTRADLRKLGPYQRQAWRVALSSALSDLRDTGELVHPGINRHAWMVP